eukprot:TRINITY_DN6795_c0_g1_i1.p1 TRINITY_DN6795_c0_g1~~TRINITY_DN6795_c0_g1_i1.p1  ORF type:complete len:557 (+),score=95.48 TRINITY_DN6795_c0_g1_i1:60-1673(+)
MGCEFSSASQHTEDFDALQGDVIVRDVHAKLTKKIVFNGDGLKVMVNVRTGGLYKVNGYTVYQEVGRGAGSSVYLACRRGRYYALKEQSKKAANPAEVACLEEINHEHVVQLIEHISSPAYHTVYTVYEYIPGGPLCKVSPTGILEEEIWDTEQTRTVFSQILETLAHLHRLGVVHRDLKPDNILFTSVEKGSVKLIDFGTVLCLKTQNDITRKTVGTPFFMPPEVCTGHRFPSKALDVWSVGVMMYLVTTGKVPFGAGCRSMAEFYLKLDEGCDNLEFPAGYDPSLAELITKILDRDVVNRVTLDEVRNHPWFTGNKYPVPLEVDGLSLFSFKQRCELPRSPTRKREMSKGGCGSGFNILVADGHYRSLHIMVTMLKMIARNVEGCVNIDSCTDADEAVKAAEGTKYDVMFLNIHNPQMSGLEASQKIKSTTLNTDTAIVGMSTSCSASLLDLCRRSGMENFLLKPLNEQDVAKILTWAGLTIRSRTSIDYDDLYDVTNCYDTCWKRKSSGTDSHIQMPITPRRVSIPGLLLPFEG